MLVRDVLRRKGGSVVTASPEVPISTMLALLGEHNVGAIVLTDRGMNLVGIASERDVVRGIQQRGAALLDEPVSTIMTTEVRVTTPDSNIRDLARTMTNARIRHLPVVERGRLIGIVSIGDIVKSRIDQLESEHESLIDYIQSSG